MTIGLLASFAISIFAFGGALVLLWRLQDSRFWFLVATTTFVAAVIPVSYAAQFLTLLSAAPILATDFREELPTLIMSIMALMAVFYMERLIRERKSLKKELRLREFSFERAAISAFWIGRDGRLLFANQRACESLGYSRDELLSKTIHDIDPNITSVEWDRHWASLKQHGFLTSETSHRTKDGQVVPMDVTANHFEFDGLEYNCTFARDITNSKQAEAALWKAHNTLDQRVRERTAELQKANADLKVEVADRTRAEAALRESEEQFRKLIEGSIQGVLIHRDGKPLFANQAIADTFGYDSPEEVVALPSIRLLKAEHEQERLEAYSAGRLQGRTSPERYEFDGVRKDGIPIRLENFVTVVDWEGEPAIQSTAINVTERKRAEEALQENEQILEARIADLEEAQRKFELQGADLVRLADDLLIARDQAEAANRAKSEFLAAMSHELRTPLNAIIGFSEIIKDETFGPVGSVQYRDYAGDINESGQHLLELINDILDLSKVESGTDELHEDDIDIHGVVRSVLKLVEHRAEHGGVKLEIELPDQLPVLCADERKLKQILVNLLSNAVKFTNAGGKVTLRFWCRTDSGYVFQIIDTGIGIALGDIPKALSRFGQVDGDLNRQYEGTGLGLPLTKALVEQHGGSLDLQSEVNVGTTVTVRFPAERILKVPRDTDSKESDAKKVG
jgi:PAS domain S-box-containing protein